jgi:hypothetical protein
VLFSCQELDGYNPLLFICVIYQVNSNTLGTEPILNVLRLIGQQGQNSSWASFVTFTRMQTPGCYGVKVLVFPRDERMKALISLKAFGLSELDAVRYYTAMLMAERGVVSAPNMAIGLPFNVSGVQPTTSADRYTTNTASAAPVAPQPPRPPVPQTR